MTTKDERLYKIACSFPALKRKGVEHGDIPGITPKGFYDQKLSNYLYKGDGGVLSSGEFLLLEFLLNICSPDTYNGFNFGNALYVLDSLHLSALVRASARVYNNE